MIALLIAVGILLALGIFFLEKRMRTAFQSLSFEMMERNQRTFFALAKDSFDKEKSEIEQKQKSFEALLGPVRESMQSIHMHQREESVSIKQQIKGLIESETRLRQETAQLASALRSPPIMMPRRKISFSAAASTSCSGWCAKLISIPVRRS